MSFFNEEIKTIFILINTIFLIIIIVIVFPEKQKEIVEPSIIEKEPKEEQIESISKEVPKIQVDIKGMVQNPGVYLVDEGTIINELIQLAGGLLEGASTKYINLSKKLINEMVIYIYKEDELSENKKIEECHCDPIIIKECIDKKSSIIIPDKENIDDGKISINNATKEELIKINGIGEVKANSIIKYRTDYGPFQCIDDLKKVEGITESLYEKIKDNLKL